MGSGKERSEDAPADRVLLLALEKVLMVAASKKRLSKLPFRKNLVANNIDGCADTVRCQVFRSQPQAIGLAVDGSDDP